MLQKMTARSRGVKRGALRFDEAFPPPGLFAERSGVTTSDALVCAGVLRASLAAHGAGHRIGTAAWQPHRARPTNHDYRGSSTLELVLV